MTEVNNTRYITGLKFTACIGVTAGHYLGIIKYISTAGFDIGRFSFLSSGPFAFLFNESYWLYLFFIASGFLLARSQIRNFADLFNRIVRRFLRLGIPVLFASLFIFVLWETVGMNNHQTAELFQNGWYQNAYPAPADLICVLRSPVDVLLLGSATFNSPYWVLKDMFTASILIYTCSYFRYKLSKNRWMQIITFGIFGVISKSSAIVLSCMIGYLIADFQSSICRHINKSRSIVLAVLGICISMVYSSYLSAVVMFSILIIIIPLFPHVNRFFSTKPLIALSQLSFGIYSFHWPVVCSIGACILLATWDFGAGAAFSICWICSAIVTLVLSYLFHISAEKMTGWVVRKVTI